MGDGVIGGDGHGGGGCHTSILLQQQQEQQEQQHHIPAKPSGVQYINKYPFFFSSRPLKTWHASFYIIAPQ